MIIGLKKYNTNETKLHHLPAIRQTNKRIQTTSVKARQHKNLIPLLCVLPLMHQMFSAFWAEFLQLFCDFIVSPLVVVSNVVRTVAFTTVPCAILTFPFRHLFEVS